jgi:uncharacterized damage-inducible protein DinB
MAVLRAELDTDASAQDVFQELRTAIGKAEMRVRALATGDLAAPRVVGRKELPTTLGGLLVHVADHTQRHVGQAITTAKFVRAMSSNP